MPFTEIHPQIAMVVNQSTFEDPSAELKTTIFFIDELRGEGEGLSVNFKTSLDD